MNIPGSRLNEFDFFFSSSPSNDNRQVAFDQGRRIQGFSTAAEIPEGGGPGEVLASCVWRR